MTECVRTEDDWLLEVQQQMREGSLSENNWHFLHGRATTVPGSWIGETCTCGNASCIGLVGDPNLLIHECSVCKADRQSRHRVMNATDDKQFMETLHTEFVNAPAIFLTMILNMK